MKVCCQCLSGCYCRCHWYSDKVYDGDCNVGQEVRIVSQEDKQPVEGRNPHYTKLLEKMKTTHEAKSHDYAKDSNVFSNFDYAEKVAEPFQGIHKVFATMVGVKLARLAELLYVNPDGSSKKPKHESVTDSGLDMANYSAIWVSRMMKDLERVEEEIENGNSRGASPEVSNVAGGEVGGGWYTNIRTSPGKSPMPTLRKGGKSKSASTCFGNVPGCYCRTISHNSFPLPRTPKRAATSNTNRGNARRG